MMCERRRKRQILKIDHYDGQCIYSGRALYYELGGCLGGGATGVFLSVRMKRHVPIKILNRVGDKLLPSLLLSRCIFAVRRKPLEPTNANAHDEECDKERFVDDPTVVAYEDPRAGMVREQSLPQCIDVWDSDVQVHFHDDTDRKFATQHVRVSEQALGKELGRVNSALNEP